MFFMELRSVLGGRRSIRFFDPDRQVERAKIQRILEAMRIASCAVNAHWLRAVVVNRAEIPAATLEALVAGGGNIKGMANMKKLTEAERVELVAFLTSL